MDILDIHETEKYEIIEDYIDENGKIKHGTVITVCGIGPRRIIFKDRVTHILRYIPFDVFERIAKKL